MKTKEIAQTLINGGKQLIDHTNRLHKVLSEMSDYNLSVVADELERNGLHLEWMCIEDVYNIY